jgi:dipeptidyl aminopeptidase/acylaminoacyl peptidase
MKIYRLTCACFLPLLAPAMALAQSSGADDRQLTPPLSITSASSPKARPIPIDDLFYTRSVADASWSPDGKEIAFSMDMSGRLNLWKVSAAGGWPIQLVQSDERQRGAAWSPDGKWIVYQQDWGGNELWDTFAVPSEGGEIVNLTDSADVAEEAPRWSPDGRTIALKVKAKTGTQFDLALLDWASRKIRQLTHERSPDRSWSSVAWSADGRTLYANRTEATESDGDVFAIDVATGKSTNLTPHEANVLHLASALSPDGKSLLISSNARGGYQNVAMLDIASGQLTWVTDTRWEANAGDFSPSGKSLTYTLNADGRSDVYQVDIATLRAEKLPLKAGLNTLGATQGSYSPNGDRLLLSHESSGEPVNFWVHDAVSGRDTQLTHTAIASLSSAVMPEARIVHYKSFDGLTISALLWMPFNLPRDGSHPALVLPHGGPTWQMKDYWSPDIAALVSRGYICIAPNVRGSTGYGMAFQRANYQDLGGGDLQDVVYAANFLKETGYVDPKRIGITGGSYGGYMTMMAIAKTPDLWAAGVEVVGPFDWMSMLKHADPLLAQYIRSLLGDPVKDADIYRKTAPITYIGDVKAPLLVLQGDNDPRIPKEEALQVVDRLKKDDKVVDAHFYANEGHGFRKRENQIDATRRTVEWFDRYLKVKR